VVQDAAERHGRLFRSEKGNPIQPSTWWQVWQKVRALSLTPTQATSPLLRRPYDLRHSGVTRRLNSGTPATEVAAWAGHSVEVLMRVYARCMTGLEDVWIARMDQALQLEDPLPRPAGERARRSDLWGAYGERRASEGAVSCRILQWMTIRQGSHCAWSGHLLAGDRMGAPGSVQPQDIRMGCLKTLGNCCHREPVPGRGSPRVRGLAGLDFPAGRLLPGRGGGGVRAAVTAAEDLTERDQ
jgi:hypothetical protein